MIYAAVFFAGMVAPYVAWFALACAHDYVWQPLVSDPLARRYWRRVHEREREARERGDCTCGPMGALDPTHHYPSCPKRSAK